MIVEVCRRLRRPSPRPRWNWPRRTGRYCPCGSESLTSLTRDAAWDRWTGGSGSSRVGWTSRRPRTQKCDLWRGPLSYAMTRWTWTLIARKRRSSCVPLTHPAPNKSAPVHTPRQSYSPRNRCAPAPCLSTQMPPPTMVAPHSHAIPSTTTKNSQTQSLAPTQ